MLNLFSIIGIKHWFDGFEYLHNWLRYDNDIFSIYSLHSYFTLFIDTKHVWRGKGVTFGSENSFIIQDFWDFSVTDRGKNIFFITSNFFE